MKVNQFKRWIFALTVPDGDGIAGVVVGATVVTVFLAFYIKAWWLFLPAVLFFSLYAVLVKVGLDQYDRLGQKAIEAAASAWVGEGEDADEVRRRQDCMMTMGAVGALASEGVSAMRMLANIDGTPMIEGTFTDIKGNPFGVTEDTFSTDFSMDAGNDLFQTTDYEYGYEHDASSSMDHNDFMNSH
jgi:hypothetical protein